MKNSQFFRTQTNAKCNMTNNGRELQDTFVSHKNGEGRYRFANFFQYETALIIFEHGYI